MKILKFEKTNENYYKMVVDANNGERFTKRDKFFHEGEKYIVKGNKCLDCSHSTRIYEVSLLKKPQLTIYNYDDINFNHVFKIERADETTVLIRREGIVSEYTFEGAEDCLREYLQLKSIYREEMSNG